MSAGGHVEAILRDFERRGPGVVRRRVKPGVGWGRLPSDRRGKGKERGWREAGCWGSTRSPGGDGGRRA